MATIPTVSHGAYKNTPRRIYIASRVFNNDFYTYTVTTDVNGLRTGALTVVTSDAAQTPVGRTLRETGAKLYPGANPGITTYMVKVYDDQTGLSGFINPNSAVFAIFNTDKPTYLTDGSEITSPAGSFSGQNEGNSIYTLGDVVAGGNASVGINLSAGGLISSSASTGITATGTNRATAAQLSAQLSNITTVASGTGVILPSTLNVGTAVIIANNGANVLKVYAAGSATIDGTAGSTGVNLTNARRAIFMYVATDVWISLVSSGASS